MWDNATTLGSSVILEEEFDPGKVGWLGGEIVELCHYI